MALAHRSAGDNDTGWDLRIPFCTEDFRISRKGVLHIWFLSTRVVGYKGLFEYHETIIHWIDDFLRSWLSGLCELVPSTGDGYPWGSCDGGPGHWNAGFHAGPACSLDKSANSLCKVAASPKRTKHWERWTVTMVHIMVWMMDSDEWCSELVHMFGLWWLRRVHDPTMLENYDSHYCLSWVVQIMFNNVYSNDQRWIMANMVNHWSFLIK